MTEIIDFINSHVRIDQSDLQIVLTYFKERKIKKDKFALKKGQIATEYFFIKSGGLRVCVDNNYKQSTAWVALENEFFTDLTSVKKQTPTHFNIQAIEDTVLLTIKHEKMELLYRQLPVWQEFGRKIWEDAFLKVISALLEFQTLSAEERYLNNMKNSDYLKRIPLKDLASFLGVTQSSLSRLRKNIK